MDVLSKITARQIVHYGVSEMLLTILTCYTIAVAFGHVPAWLPLISDCAVKPPEMYLFRLGFVFGASLIALSAFIVHYANKDRPLSSLNAVLALVASISLGGLAVVNEVEDGSVHLFFSVLFFVCYDLYMIISVLTTITRKPSNCTGFGLTITVSSFIIKTICAILGVITGTGYTLGIFSFTSVGGSIALAMFEWGNTFTIMGFIWSYLLDNFLTGVDIFEVRVKSEKDSKKSQEIKKVLP